MRLLLDSHIPQALATQLRRSGVEAFHISEWRDGALRNASDATLLSEAAIERWVFVTGDQRATGLLRQLAEFDRSYAGLILLTRTQVGVASLGSTLRALRRVAEADEDWTDRAQYLPDEG